ncbi:MAG: hypothetical protein RLZZ196_2492 [Bacteroidota bacterium]|jgi:hypothetical protein
MDFSSLINYDSNNMANSENAYNTQSSINFQKNSVAKQLRDAKGSSYLEIGGLSEMIVPTLLKNSGITNISLDDLKTVATDLTPDIDISSILNTARSNVANLFKSENTNDLTEDIPMETFSNMSKQTIFESPEIQNPVYDPAQFDKTVDEPITNDLTENITENVAKSTLDDTLETIGEGIGDAALTVATDGVGSIVSGILGVAGLAGGAYSFYEGFKDLFTHPHQSVINYVPQATGNFVAE